SAHKANAPEQSHPARRPTRLPHAAPSPVSLSLPLRPPARAQRLDAHAPRTSSPAYPRTRLRLRPDVSLLLPPPRRPDTMPAPPADCRDLPPNIPATSPHPAIPSPPPSPPAPV